jgi:hypothetical protein
MLIEDDHIIRELVEGIHKIEHSLPLIAATENPSRMELLATLGVQKSFIKKDSTIIVVFEALMRALEYSEQQIKEALERALQLLEPEGIFPQTGLSPIAEAQPVAA